MPGDCSQSSFVKHTSCSGTRRSQATSAANCSSQSSSLSCKRSSAAWETVKWFLPLVKGPAPQLQIKVPLRIDPCSPADWRALPWSPHCWCDTSGKAHPRNPRASSKLNARKPTASSSATSVLVGGIFYCWIRIKKHAVSIERIWVSILSLVLIVKKMRDCKIGETNHHSLCELMVWSVVNQ